MEKIKNSLMDIGMILLIGVCGLIMLPYLLVRVWVNTILLKKEMRGLDFDLRG